MGSGRLWWRRVAFLASLALHLEAVPPADGAEFALKAGSESEVAWGGDERPSLRIWVPAAAAVNGPGPAVSAWPVIFYFHGTGGVPTTKWMRRVAGEEAFVIVGMSYARGGRFVYAADQFPLLVKDYHDLWHALSQHLPLDRNRIYVAGFSKGGWVSGLLLEKDPTLAGGMILGAGIYLRPGEKAASLRKGVPILLGVGERDLNVAMAYRGLRHFRELGGEVKVDAWRGVGHDLPDEPTATRHLRQWWRIEALRSHPARLRSAADEWGDGLWQRSQELNDPVEAYRALRTMAEAPFEAWLSDPRRRDLASRLAALSEWAPVQRERSAMDAYTQTLAAEGRDRRLETLVDCSRSYREVLERYPGTEGARLAELGLTRVRRLLGESP